MQEYYRKWLIAAYRYYIRAGEDTGMSDYEWDCIGRMLFASKEHLPKELYPVIHDPRYAGGSLFWLTAGEYPQWAKV